MLFCELELELTIEGRYLVASSNPSTPGVDTPVLLTEDRCLLLPYSAVKGKVREVLADVARGRPEMRRWVKHWLMDRETTDFQPDRGRIRFTDFIGQSEQPSVLPTGIRIAKDLETKSVRPGHLQIYEAPLKSRQQERFAGKLRFLASSEAEANNVQKTVVGALKLIGQFGQNRTIGFGQLRAVKGATLHCRPLLESASIPKTVDAFVLELRPEAPFCVTKRKVLDNLFESDTQLSGAVVKGTVAGMLREASGLAAGGSVNESQINAKWQTLAKYLDCLRFSVAVPTPDQSTTYPTVPPKSLVYVNCLAQQGNHDGIQDVALCDGPCLIGSANEKSAPQFEVDWKGIDVDAKFGQVPVSKQLRVRTAIDESTRRSLESALFAYEMAEPRGLKWVSTVCLDRIPAGDREAVARQLTGLVAQGVWGIGKTKSFATASIREQEEFTATDFARELEVQIGQPVIVTLQSDAIMHDPHAAHFEALGEGARTRKQVLFDAYAEYWQSISAGMLKLSHFFASQRLAGGEYYARRFMGSKRKDYQPYVLTEAGSVFVLEPSQLQHEQVSAYLRGWRRNGLPLSRHLGTSLSFQQCPFRPEEGFGEIRVNLSVHTQLKPTEVEYV